LHVVPSVGSRCGSGSCLGGEAREGERDGKQGEGAPPQGAGGSPAALPPAAPYGAAFCATMQPAAPREYMCTRGSQQPAPTIIAATSGAGTVPSMLRKRYW